MALQSQQEFFPIRKLVPNDRLAEGMLRWSLILPPYINIITAAAAGNPLPPVRVSSIGGPVNLGRATVNDPSSSISVPGFNVGHPRTQGFGGSTVPAPGGSGSAPLPADQAVPNQFLIYTFTPTVSSSVAQVSQLASMRISLSYYLPDWTFSIWIPSTQEYIEFISSAAALVDNGWVTINAARNIECSGSATIEFIFGQKQAQTADLTAPYGTIAVHNYQIHEHLFVERSGPNATQLLDANGDVISGIGSSSNIVASQYLQNQAAPIGSAASPVLAYTVPVGAAGYYDISAYVWNLSPTTQTVYTAVSIVNGGVPMNSLGAAGTVAGPLYLSNQESPLPTNAFLGQTASAGQALNNVVVYLEEGSTIAYYNNASAGPYDQMFLVQYLGPIPAPATSAAASGEL